MATGAEDYSNVGEFGINVQVSVEVPEAEGVATAANQTTMITALQLIDDLRNALGSVDTDDLQVDIKTAPTLTVQSTGADKISGFSALIHETPLDYSLDAGTNNVDGTAVPTGEIWILQSVCAYVASASITRFSIDIIRDGAAHILENVISPVDERWYTWAGGVYMDAGDYVRLHIEDATAGDDGVLDYTGIKMTVP